MNGRFHSLESKIMSIEKNVNEASSKITNLERTAKSSDFKHTMIQNLVLSLDNFLESLCFGVLLPQPLQHLLDRLDLFVDQVQINLLPCQRFPTFLKIEVGLNRAMNQVAEA